MKKITALSSVLFISIFTFSQKISGKLKFEQGQTFDVTVQVKNAIAQQAMESFSAANHF
jgi:hypothetical protein